MQSPICSSKTSEQPYPTKCTPSSLTRKSYNPLAEQVCIAAGIEIRRLLFHRGASGIFFWSLPDKKNPPEKKIGALPTKRFRPGKNLEPSRRKNSVLEKIWSPPDEKIPPEKKFGGLPMERFLRKKNLEPSR
jgi:hypothetical protein